MTSGEPVTRSEWVTRQLRAAILSGAFAPGERLLTPDLTQRFSVSPTPLREALQALASEGIVEWTPQRGARVAPISDRECRELHELRLVVQPMAVALSLKLGNAAWLAGAETAFTEYRRVLRSRKSSTAELEEAHRNFHTAVISGCGNGWLIRLNQLLLQGSARYRSAAFGSVKRASCIATAERLVDACRRRAETEALNATVADIDSVVIELGESSDWLGERA